MDAARRSAGGLPAGAVVVVTGLSRPVVPEAGLSLAASFAGLGRVKLDFA
jgi:2-keto-4-pentenoate hydratase